MTKQTEHSIPTRSCQIHREWTYESRIIRALIIRLGGHVTLSDGELTPTDKCGMIFNGPAEELGIQVVTTE